MRNRISKKGRGVGELIKEVWGEEKISASTETAEVHFAYRSVSTEYF